MNKQILQIMPAPDGMVAEWGGKKKSHLFLPVVGLALVINEKGQNLVDGVVCTGNGFELCHSIKHFRGFCLSGLPINSFILEDQDRRERLENFISQKCEREGIPLEGDEEECEGCEGCEECEHGEEGDEPEEMDLERLEMEEMIMQKNEGEFARIALAVRSGDLPLAQISAALHSGDIGELVKIKQNLREKLDLGRCPICGRWSTQMTEQ